MAELHDWQKQFKLKGNLVELDVENLERALENLPRAILSNTGYAARLKAAIAAGWVLEPASEVGDFDGTKRCFYAGQNVDEMKPGAVRWLGQQVDRAYDEATEIPKNL